MYKWYILAQPFGLTHFGLLSRNLFLFFSSFSFPFCKSNQNPERIRLRFGCKFWKFWRFLKMGLSNFPHSAEGVLLLPVLVMNTVMSMAFLKNLVRSVIQMMSASASPSSSEEEYDSENGRERRISITQFKSLRQSFNGETEDGSASRCVMAECCVCLCGFEADEEVSELSCKHFFHKGCLSKWFDNKHITCPLCRSIE